jgi:hypothetical protein
VELPSFSRVDNFSSTFTSARSASEILISLIRLFSKTLYLDRNKCMAMDLVFPFVVYMLNSFPVHLQYDKYHVSVLMFIFVLVSYIQILNVSRSDIYISKTRFPLDLSILYIFFFHIY